MIDKKNVSLVKELALTDFKLKYNGSFFGYLWSLMKPLMYFSVLYVVFGLIFKIGKGVPNYPVYLLLGVTLFNFFSEVTSSCMSSIVSRGALIRKVYFPRIVLTLSASITALITLALNLIVVFGFAYFLKVDFTWSVLWLPLILVEFYILALGVSFLLAALFVKFRDVGHIWEVVSQALFYVTPILYPLTLVPDNFLKYLMLSPLAQIVQDTRKMIISPTLIDSSSDVLVKWTFIPYVSVFIIFIVGYLVYRKMSAKFAEEV